MHIGLIGMSGIGKSFWASKLAGAGYKCLDCDDLIAARLRDELAEPLATVYDLGDWMGFPYEAGYAEREAIYLRTEVEVLQEIVAGFSQAEHTGKAYVIDMTGSAIYAGATLLTQLRRHAKIVYLAASPDQHPQLLDEYVRRPRPVIWQGLYRNGTHEPPSSALARCYANLIAFREKLYEAYSDVKIDYHIHRRPEFEVDDFLRYIDGRAN